MAMKTVEERLTISEHKVAENARGIDRLREAIVELGNRMERGFEAMDRRFEAIDRRFETIDRRFEAMDRRFEAIEQRFDQRLGAINQTMDRRFVAMDQKLSRQFFWLVRHAGRDPAHDTHPLTSRPTFITTLASLPSAMMATVSVMPSSMASAPGRQRDHRERVVVLPAGSLDYPPWRVGGRPAVMLSSE